MSGVRVLVVEDDREVRESTAQLLLEAGYEVLGAGSGPEALAQLHGGYRPAVRLPAAQNGEYAGGVTPFIRRYGTVWPSVQGKWSSSSISAR